MNIIGVEERGRQGTVVKSALQKVGFRISELEFVTTIPEVGEGWYLVLGSPALKEYVGPHAMADVSGLLMHCHYNQDALCVPNYAPGFLYHNPGMKGLWTDNLKNAFLLYQLDTKGVIA